MNGFAFFRVLVSPAFRNASALALLLGLGLGMLEPERLWGSVLAAGVFLCTLSLAGALFLAIQHAGQARWSIGFHALPSAMASFIGWTALPVLAALVFGRHHLYGWLHAGGAEHLAAGFRETWLQPQYLLARAALYFVIWHFAARRLRRIAPEQGPAQGRGAAFLVIYAFTFSLACVDWLMALQPHWYSTIFAVYIFSGMLLAGLAAVTLSGIALGRLGLRPALGPEQRHDLGKLMFGFSVFWAYIWFSQFMLIWYSNIPEEVTFFLARQGGGWGFLTLVNIVLHWAFPFLLLMTRAAKRSEGALMMASAALLAAHALDMFWLVMPAVSAGQSPSLGVVEAGVWLGLAGLFLDAFLKRFENRTS